MMGNRLGHPNFGRLLLPLTLLAADFHTAGGLLHNIPSYVSVQAGCLCPSPLKLIPGHAIRARIRNRWAGPLAVSENIVGLHEENMHESDLALRFGGVEKLHGSGTLERLAASKVCVFGIGGVGSWVVEALARSGVGELMMVDMDEVCISNVNRQIHALTGEIGRPKVEVMAERIARINPVCKVSHISCFLSRSNAPQLFGFGGEDRNGAHIQSHQLGDKFRRVNLTDMDLVIDAIDNLDDKAALISMCVRTRTPVVTCGAAGGLVDPTLVRTGDFAATQDDRLLSKTRKRLRQAFGFPNGDPYTNKGAKWGITAIYSLELLPPTKQADVCTTEDTFRACDTSLGSSVAVTGAFGLAAAAVAVRQLVSTKGAIPPRVRIDSSRVKVEGFKF